MRRVTFHAVSKSAAAQVFQRVGELGQCVGDVLGISVLGRVVRGGDDEGCISGYG